MKTTNFIGWAGISLLFASVVTTGACSKSAEGFCQSWVEDTCNAIAGCCKAGKKYDADQCRIELSKTCLDAVDLEQIHSGERVFNAGAASECLGSVDTCADLDTLGTNNLTYDRAKACRNVVTGFRPPGSACSSDKDCQQSGEFAFCYEPANGTGVCVNVVLDDAKCSFSFDDNELHICPEGKYCDNAGFEPPASASPTSQEFEFSASCKPDVGAGGKCVDGDGHSLPCAKGLYCDITGGNSATCKARKAAGTACNYSQECAESLTCEANPSGNGETCQAASANGPFCFSPPVCGDGICNGNETAASCPKDCAGGGGCGDGFCDVGAGESTFCPQDCCGNGSCDPGETTTCPTDCGV